MTHVAYKGFGETQHLAMDSDVQMITDGSHQRAELRLGGKQMELPVTGDKRIAAFPPVPVVRNFA